MIIRVLGKCLLHKLTVWKIFSSKSVKPLFTIFFHCLALFTRGVLSILEIFSMRIWRLLFQFSVFQWLRSYISKSRWGNTEFIIFRGHLLRSAILKIAYFLMVISIIIFLGGYSKCFFMDPFQIALRVFWENTSFFRVHASRRLREWVPHGCGLRWSWGVLLVLRIKCPFYLFFIVITEGKHEVWGAFLFRGNGRREIKLCFTTFLFWKKEILSTIGAHRSRILIIW